MILWCTVQTPSNRFPRACRRRPCYGRSGTNSTVTPPTPSCFGELVKHDEALNGILVDNGRRLLLKPHHAGARRILLTVGHHRCFHRPVKRCEVRRPPRIEVLHEMVGLIGCNFDCNSGVTPRPSPCERPQAYETRHPMSDAFREMTQQCIKHLRCASAGERICVVETQPTHATTYGRNASPRSCSSIHRVPMACSPMSACTR